ncbi:hypothetical protein [Amycolatopsis sp. 3B14]|uniref:hypothetical protein n=1 Tax=Amycolatopsis sp. 3B14 TaxID=3243600 RepID=UPI003D967505
MTEKLLIDEYLPVHEAHQLDAIVVDTPPDAAYRAVRDLDPDKVAQAVPLLRVLGRARAIPAAIADRIRGDTEPPPESLPAEEYQAAFVLLDERPGTEFVVGMIGKFMTATQLEFRRFEPGEFAGFDEPGYGKVALNFVVQPYGPGRSLLTTETRTATTDPLSRNRFARYWTVVGPFAGFIMRRWLRLAKHNAESAERDTVQPEAQQ